MRAAPKAASAWQFNFLKVGPVLTVQRLLTRPQFQAVLASKLGVRTVHFALHSCDLGQVICLSTAQQPALGVMVPKRWAKRAVTRNAIKRQIYTVSEQFSAQLTPRAHLVRLRAAYDRKEFISATSDVLKSAVRAELLELFTLACAHPQLRA